MKRFLMAALAVCVIIVSGTVPACARRGLTLKGSDTMVILAQRWAESYMNKNRGAIVQVTGGGSGVGIASLINGTTDIATASRQMKQDEKLKLRDRFQSMGVEIPVARDGLSIYLHPSNPVKALTLEQLSGIYRGTITSWKQVGGPDRRIILYGRENNSGTYGFFKDNVLGGKDFAPQTQTLQGTAAVVNAVSKDASGIGYGGVAYTKGVRDCAIARDAKSKAILPTPATVKDGSYPLSRHLYFYTRQAPARDIKKFIDYVKSPEGQALATQVGYFPLQ